MRCLPQPQFRRSIEGLQDEWQGWTYDLLSRNCNHFCEALVEILGVGPLPAWVNRFAVNADYALETSQTALTEVKKMWKSSTDSMAAATGWLKDHLTIGASIKLWCDFVSNEKRTDAAACAVMCRRPLLASASPICDWAGSGPWREWGRRTITTKRQGQGGQRQRQTTVMTQCRVSNDAMTRHCVFFSRPATAKRMA